MTVDATRDSYLALHLWREAGGALRGRLLHPRLPDGTPTAAAGRAALQLLVEAGLDRVELDLSSERDVGVTDR